MTNFSETKCRLVAYALMKDVNEHPGLIFKKEFYLFITSTGNTQTDLLKHQPPRAENSSPRSIIFDRIDELSPCLTEPPLPEAVSVVYETITGRLQQVLEHYHLLENSQTTHATRRLDLYLLRDGGVKWTLKRVLSSPKRLPISVMLSASADWRSRTVRCPQYKNWAT